MAGTKRQAKHSHHVGRRHRAIRLPDTVCIEERLPAGAAAIPINRNHAYADLPLPIDAQEREMFDAIDGVRSAGAIGGSRLHSDAARAFFRRLWQYDQVAFDASRLI